MDQEMSSLMKNNTMKHYQIIKNCVGLLKLESGKSHILKFYVIQTETGSSPIMGIETIKMYEILKRSNSHNRGYNEVKTNIDEVNGGHYDEILREFSDVF